MGHLQFIGSLVLIGLFIFAIGGFAVNFGNDNNSAVNLANDAELTGLKSQMQGNMSELRSQSEGTYKSILETQIPSGGDNPSNVAPFSIINPLGVITYTLKVAYIRIFGTGKGFGYFITAIISFLTVSLIYFAYKTLRGIPD